MAEEKPGVTIVDIQQSEDKKLSFTHSFRVDWVDQETGQTNTGTFTCRRPTIGMIGEVAIIKARLNGGENVGRDVDFLNEMRAFLQVVLTKTPDWWKPDEFFEAAPLRKVWDHVRSWQDSFRNRSVAE